MVARRANSFAFGTLFYPKVLREGHVGVKRMTKHVDIFALDLIFVPVHLGDHWCLAVVDMLNKTMLYYDSYGSQNQACMDTLVQYLEKEHLAKEGVRDIRTS